MASEASKQIIELVKQWSEQSSLSTEKFDLQALRTAMSTTQEATRRGPPTRSDARPSTSTTTTRSTCSRFGRLTA